MKCACNVTNKSAGSVVYVIQELGVRRSFAPNETKRDIDVLELEKLVQMPGGLELVYNYLLIEDKEVAQYIINRQIEPEYWLAADKIPSWMQTCTLDEFKDALDFAPQGTKDLIKKFAVDLELNDYSKREAIKEQLDFDVTKAIKMNKAFDEDKPKEEEKQTTRRATVAQPAQRRV